MLHLRELRDLRRRSVPSDVIHRQLQQQQQQKDGGVFISNEDVDYEEDEEENSSQKACPSNYIPTSKPLPAHLTNESSLHKSNTSLTGSTPRIQINGQDSTESEHPANKKFTYSALPEHLLKHCGVIKKSWKAANERITAFGTDRCFGFFVLDRVFEKAPALKELFDVAQFIKLADAPEQHPFTRHTRIFNSIIDLSLDQFNEETVRMFCGQIVCTMLDLLGDELNPEGLESWIEMTRYLGTALLSGFEYERLANTKKISINTKQHAYFVL
uniref:Globin family profile domain-containing protein n=1 Tax=Ditylenchus dipsaci TaxID=166011 RepID=A0A915E967_9BILA